MLENIIVECNKCKIEREPENGKKSKNQRENGDKRRRDRKFYRETWTTQMEGRERERKKKEIREEGLNWRAERYGRLSW